MSKYDLIIKNKINGSNYDVTTSDIVEKLKLWDSISGIDIVDVTNDCVLFVFKSLPEDLDSLSQEIYEFCPDLIDQNYGCMDQMIEMMEESGQELPQDILDLVDGVDFSENDFGMKLLKKSLIRTKQVLLWWD